MKQTASYKQLSEELDALLDKMQSSDLDIDQAIKYYEQGIELVNKLKNYLEEAENTVSKLKQSFDGK